MEPINNVGATNYAMTVPQNQSQIQGYEDYASMPMVYEPEMEQKKKASSGMLGLTALGIVAAGGLGFLAGRNKVKNLNNQIGELRTLNEELKTKLDVADVAKKAAEDAKKAAEDAKKDVENSMGKELTGWWKRLGRIVYPRACMSDEAKAAKDAYKASKKEADKVAKEAKKAEKAAEKTEKAAEKTESKKTDDTSKS